MFLSDNSHLAIFSSSNPSKEDHKRKKFIIDSFLNTLKHRSGKHIGGQLVSDVPTMNRNLRTLPFTTFKTLSQQLRRRIPHHCDGEIIDLYINSNLYSGREVGFYNKS